MKYYLVDYLILEDKTVLENEQVYMPMHSFSGIGDFKQTIADSKDNYTDPESIVIKNYSQVSSEEFNRVNMRNA